LDEFRSGFVTKDVSDEEDKSLSGESNSSFGDWTILVDIVSWNNLIFTLSEAIVNMLGDLEGFILERCEINGIGLRFRELELFDKIISKTSKS